MNAAEEMVIGAARQAAERGDVTALEASLLIVVDNQQAAIQRVRELHKGTSECAHCAGVTGLPDGAKVDTCDECCEVMPCPTIRALDGTDD